MNLIQFINNLGNPVEQGDVVVIGDNQTAHYHDFDKSIFVPEVDFAQSAYDTRVCGVVYALQTQLKLGTEALASSEATKPAKAKGSKKQREPEAAPPQAFTSKELDILDRTTIGPGQVGSMVVLGAFAHCKVDADIAPIQVGDLLTTSPTKGHAQKILDPTRAPGVIVGKALGSLKKGKGKIPVLVMLQ